VIVTRDEEQGRGPLEGLRAGLKALPASVDSAYVTSCDVPLLVLDFVRRMIDLLADHDIAVMEIDGFPHPLSAVYRRSTLPHVEALLAQNRLRPVFLFDAVRTRRVQPAEIISADPELLTLLRPGEDARVSAWGRAIRLAQRLSGGTEALLRKTSIGLEPGRVVLSIPTRHQALYADSVDRRLHLLARALGRVADVRLI